MLRAALLGRMEVYLDQEPVDLRLRTVQLLLAYLLLNRDRNHQREQLAGRLWPGYTDASARKNLRNTIYRLRKAIGDDYLQVDRASVAFNPSADYRLDVEQLERASGSNEIETLLEAAESYRGKLLPGFYEEWILWERERLQSTFDQVLAKLLEGLGGAGRWEESIAWAERWIAQGQTPEPAYRAMMRAHAARDDRVAVAQTYRRASQALEDELGVTLSAESERLYQSLMTQNQAAAPEIEAAGDKAGAPSTPRPKGRLPHQATSFIGRQSEIARLSDMLCQPNGGRLLTIVGPGGIGKTRLSLETAEAATDHFADGVYFVPLAPVIDAQHLVATVSDSLEYRSTGGDPRQGLLDYLASKQLLLLVDNFEHLLSGVDLVSDILHSAPRVRILCTSRERLNLSSETVYMLSGMAYPDGDYSMADEEIAELGAVQLLLDRARLARPGLELSRPELVQAGRICRLVQGMPLALVLAAGWLEMLTFEELADEIAASLDILESQAWDMPERQRSVRAAFEYSWARLTAEEQAVFARLAIFRGGFTRRAALEVAGAGLRELRTLVEKSLITIEGPDRYAVHELLRQFAEGKLELAGQADTVRDTHSRYYLQALATREQDVKGRRQWEALEEIEADLGNVRAAWDRALKIGAWQDTDRALESIYLYLYIRSRYQEGWTMLHGALAGLSGRYKGTPAERDRLWARLVSRAGVLRSQFSSSAPDIEQDIQRSLAIAERQDDKAQIAHANLALGHYHSKTSGDFRQAAAYFKEGLERYKALGDNYFVAHLLHRVGYAIEPIEGLEAFVRYTSQSLDLARQIGDEADQANALGNLGSGSFANGDYLSAETCLREGLALDRKMGDRQGIAQALIELGLLEFLFGRLDEARETTAEGYRLAQLILSSNAEAYGSAVFSLLASLNGNYKEGQRLAAENQALMSNVFGRFLGHWASAVALAGLGRPAEALAEALTGCEMGRSWGWYGIVTWTLPVFAIIYAQKDEPSRAAMALGLFFNHPMSAVGWAKKWSLLSDTQNRLEAALSSEGYKAAWESGR